MLVKLTLNVIYNEQFNNKKLFWIIFFCCFFKRFLLLQTTARMPTYIYNTLTLISETPEVLDEFYRVNRLDKKVSEYDFHDESVLTFSCLISADIHGEQAKQWGCKWDASSPTYSRSSPKECKYEFTTAWSPPGGWLEKVSTRFPDIIFKLTYMCEDMGYFGKCEYRSGVYKKVYEYQYDEFHEYIKKELGLQLGDIYNEIVIQKSQLGCKVLELDDDGNNEVLDNIIAKFNLNRDFSGINASMVFDLYNKMYGKLNN